MNPFLIQLAADDDDRASWLLTGGGRPAIQHGTLEEAIAAAGSHPVVVLAPTERLVLTTTELQIRNKAKLRKALPFALEEQLASDVEELHFALAPHGDEQAVAVIERELLDHWLAAFRQQQRTPRAIIPDVLALPYQEGDWFVACDTRRALVRTGRFGGFACDRENLALLLGAALDSSDEQPANIHLWPCGDDQPLAYERETPRLLKHRCDGELLQLLAESVDTHNAINLLQGDYSVQTDLIKTLKPWRWAAGLAALLLGLGYAGMLIEQKQLAREQAELRQQAEQIYRQTFPGVRKVVNPRVQMEQRLKRLRGGGEQPRDRFLDLLASASQVIAADDKAQLESIRYRKGRLDLKVNAPTLSRLDALKNAMIAAGLEAELTNADAAGGKAVGNLRVKQK